MTTAEAVCDLAGSQVVRLDAIDDEEMRELVLDAWRMVVPKGVARQRLG